MYYSKEFVMHKIIFLLERLKENNDMKVFKVFFIDQNFDQMLSFTNLTSAIATGVARDTGTLSFCQQVQKMGNF